MTILNNIINELKKSGVNSKNKVITYLSNIPSEDIIRLRRELTEELNRRTLNDRERAWWINGRIT